MNFSSVVKELLFPRKIYCASCGDELMLQETAICDDCREQLPNKRRYIEIEGIKNVQVAFAYEGMIRDLIHRFKYNNQRYLAYFLANMLKNFYADEKGILIPVPLHKRKYKERGFCQTTEIGKQLCDITGKTIDKKTLIRIKDTQSQTNLNETQRKENIVGAFEASDKYLKNRQYILIDDVVSTGATLYECAQELHKVGITNVIAWIVAG